MKVNCVYAWPGVYSFCQFCWKTFLIKQKQMERNGDKHTWICPIETLACNCWTNEKTLGQLDADLSTCVFLRCKPSFIDPLFLKWSAKIVATPITSLFNLSSVSSESPKDWKAATVIPLFKGGETLDPNCYRPTVKKTRGCNRCQRCFNKVLSKGSKYLCKCDIASFFIVYICKNV